MPSDWLGPNDTGVDEEEPRREWSVLVIWNDGDREYLREGTRVATFPSRSRAAEMRAFMLEGIADEVQSINVVPAPDGARRDDP